MVSNEQMKKYLMLFEDTVMAEEPEFEEVRVDEMLDQHNFDTLLEDIAELKNKLESHQCVNASEEFAEGYETGMFDAANLILSLLETKYGRRV